ncbi:MAG TPA: glycerate kinase [Clostridiaceae bacterium]|nr:glycerate kinase [Clostridiaceae bacterium]
MNIVIAPDSFKGSASAKEIAGFIKNGILTVDPSTNCMSLPISDGGEGFCDAMLAISGGERFSMQVVGADGHQQDASWAKLLDGTAIIELAQASGHISSYQDLNAMSTTTYGTGELIHAAIESGSRNIIVGLGGSASTDGGMGLLQALGISFKDKAGRELGYGGGELANLHEIDITGLDPQVKECEFIVACDVNNPLTGQNGAAEIFGPQKGATPEMVNELDNNLANFAIKARPFVEQDLSALPGAGAAGGTCFGLMVFCGAAMKRGIDVILDKANFEDLLKDADLVITGEGCIDEQTIFGKAPIGVALRVKEAFPQLPVIAVCGYKGPGAEKVLNYGVDEIVEINTSISKNCAMKKVKELTERAAAKIMTKFVKKEVIVLPL